MPNSVPDTKQAMLAELGVASFEELLADIPEHLRVKGNLGLPGEPLSAEADLIRHMQGLLRKNTACDEMISYLGAGCYRHYVPAICDEINGRAEFLTAYCGDTYSDHGKLQAIFEYTSMMGELLDLDVVSFTTYDGGQAAASALRMAGRITGRKELLLPKTMNPEILAQITDYCSPHLTVSFVEYDPGTGQMDMDDLRRKVSPATAAVFVESPAFLGFVADNVEDIAAVVHQAGGLCVAYVDPLSLGLLESPANQGADILCGDIQPLGIHMLYGGGCAGFIATRDEEKFILEYPTYFYGITTTSVEGQYGFGRALNFRTSHGSREKAKEYFGTEAGLWAITAGVYLALMGPQGMRDVGEHIFYKANYAQKLFGEIAGIKAGFTAAPFKEFVLNFDETGKSVAEINDELLKNGILGGKDLSGSFPQLGNSALYCVTEMTAKEDIDKTADILRKIVR
jgi:Glycine cleavage system protein P (pyridoxal-binding), N-terminal domain